ncbi:hypothetical protein GE300_20880 [Rhodobacteraceae bacterium 2CG4]|uniref:Uncharacterized protein n=1 Tax=Halovulum marinum TaxID=2662447 RepID=A0A6L5Z641_9RHOB|nr:hypothetical protein [Halovulum marinum]MSU92013.1 hypothetical protein [Halovulum marinum]
MSDMHTTDHTGPLVPLGPVAFSADTGLPGGPQTFSVPTFLAAEDESRVVVEYNGLELRDFGCVNDFYGFGSSPRTALEDARDKIARLAGCNADIKVVTKLTLRP